METFFVDAFTSEKFKGNPAAVCVLDRHIDDQLMQNIAAEIGFSETAFICHLNDIVYSIRFFTPKTEISLCGHATLASAKIVFEKFGLQNVVFTNIDNIRLLAVKQHDEIKMEFPLYETDVITIPDQMLKAIGINYFKNGRYNREKKIILIEIASPRILAELQPDFVALKNSYEGLEGVLVTALSDSKDFDFEYRYFWPWAGTNEDPVTGAVQTFLTKYWADKLGKSKLNAFQSSSRTGTMSTEVIDGKKITICGKAVITFEGKFLI